MHDIDRLKAALNAFEATLLESSRMQDGDFERGRKAAIELRRKIAAHRVEVGGLLDQALGSTKLYYAFRSRFSALCFTLALHQANWQVVTIDLKNKAYLASSADTRAAYQGFFQWARFAFSEI